MSGKLPKVFLAIPCTLNTVDAGCCMALLCNIRHLDRLGYQVELHFEVGNPYVDDARNRIAKKFLSSDCDRLLFVDSDVGFQPDAMAKILVPDYDIVGAVYPYKRDGQSYPTIMIQDEEGKPKLSPCGCLVEVQHAPTGFMSIKREVFTKMKEAHPEWIVTNNNGMCTFFAVGNVFNDGQYWGEDVTFCKRWRDMGGHIYIETDIDFVHIGRKEFVGNLHEHILSTQTSLRG